MISRHLDVTLGQYPIYTIRLGNYIFNNTTEKNTILIKI